MTSLVLPRRRFLFSLASVALCAPAVVRASSLMRISAESGPLAVVEPWATAVEAQAWVQHEMERRFTETLFGRENFSCARPGASGRSLAVAGRQITGLWELRSWFGPRIVSQGSGSARASVLSEARSSPKRFAELPAEVRAGIFSALETSL
jgi:hypothetical protein